MKIRKSFVTNSSSSCFVCEVCGREEGGFDASLSDFDMCECENGHIFCQDELLGGTDDYWDVDEKICPICSLDTISDSTMLSYVIKKYNLANWKDIKEEIQSKYNNIKEVERFIKN